MPRLKPGRGPILPVRGHDESPVPFVTQFARYAPQVGGWLASAICRLWLGIKGY